MLRVIVEIKTNEVEKYNRRHIYSDGDGPILDFDGDNYDEPLFFIPEKYSRKPFARIHIRNANFVPSDFDQLVRYAGEIYLDNSVVSWVDKIPDKIIISKSSTIQKIRDI